MGLPEQPQRPPPKGGLTLPGSRPLTGDLTELGFQLLLCLQGGL